MAPDEADTYAEEVVAAELQSGGALAKVLADLIAKGPAHNEETVRAKLGECEEMARGEFAGGTRQSDI